MFPVEPYSPFGDGGMVFPRLYMLVNAQEDRNASSDSLMKRDDIVTFYGTEPQLVQRLTENLIIAYDMETLQKSPYRIATENTTLELHKSMQVRDTVTGKYFRIITFYVNEMGVDMTVTEQND